MKTIRAVAVLVGIGIAAYGFVGLSGALHRKGLISAGQWFLGAALVHDAVLAPVVITTGILLSRVPGAVRPYLQAGLIVSGGLLLVAVPFLTGLGYQARNPSALPLDYGRGTAIAIGCVWAAVATLALGRAGARRLRSRRRPAPLDS